MLASYILHRNETPSQAGSGWIIAIDTSADRSGLALFDGERLHEHTWPSGRGQTTQVPPRIHALLDDAAVSTDDLRGVAVAIGPGTFTGLRVGLSLAKGFAMATGIPIIGVPTLEATALPWTRAGRTVVAVLPAGRGRLVWQRLAPGDGGAGGPVNGIPQDLLDAVAAEPADAIVGELPPALRAALDGASAPVLAEPGLTSRIGAVAILGHGRLALGEADDLTTLEPIYVHGTPRATRPVRDARP